MGGATVVLAGDFRQTLPIVTHDTPADQINACLKNSYLWHHVEKFNLTTNMRSHIQGDLSAGQFANKLLQIEDCDESLRNLSTNLLRRLSGEYKFAFISNQLQKEVWDIQIR
ncbi:ATP-dependent DNA helicase [Trichonephila clavipes]|nr:ATP-dependent DNA helicase [Trichonephila clavipes]